MRPGDPVCEHCAAPVRGGAVYQLVLPDGTKMPLRGSVTLGRSPDNAVRLEDRSVSRHHARVLAAGDVPMIEDAGSSYGTQVDGRPLAGTEALTDGARITLGDVELTVELRRDDADEGRTIVVPAVGTVVVGSVEGSVLDVPAPAGGMRPRMRSGWTLKRLAEDEGELRWVLRSDRDGALVRMADEQAGLLDLLDGTNELPDLIAQAERRGGGDGVAGLARLLAELGDRGFLADVEGERTAPPGRLARLVRPRELTTERGQAIVEAIYRRGGWIPFTAGGLAVITLVIVAGVAAFAWTIAEGKATPFVVGDRIGLGALVFILGRLALVVVHELAHGLAMASFGRRIPRAGVKLMIVVPFAFVDTTEAWFESRRRRIAVSAAGPASDLALGGTAAIIAALVLPGSLGDVLFQIAFAAYLGAFFNLNPFLDRDGYHMLVDALREPGLRRRARRHFAARLSGKPSDEADGRSLTIYSLASIGWMLAAAAFAIGLSTRYYGVLTGLAPDAVVWSVLGVVYALLFVPVIVVLVRPLWTRLRGGDG